MEIGTTAEFEENHAIPKSPVSRRVPFCRMAVDLISNTVAITAANPHMRLVGQGTYPQLNALKAKPGRRCAQ